MSLPFQETQLNETACEKEGNVANPANESGKQINPHVNVPKNQCKKPPVIPPTSRRVVEAILSKKSKGDET